MIRQRKLMANLAAVMLLLGVAGSAPAEELVCYPAPDDLSQVENLWLHNGSRYSVKVNGRSVPVYLSRSTNKKIELEEAYIAYFSFAGGPVQIEVICGMDVKLAAVRPYSRGVTPAVAGRTVHLTMEKPMKVWLQTNGDRKKPLFIFADAPIEDPGPKGVDHYFGPGVHHIGLKYRVKSREKVFIAGGAVLEGTFDVEETTDVSFSGRGIVAGGQWASFSDGVGHQVFESKKARNLHVEGLLCISQDSHTFDWDAGGRRVSNLKLIAFEWTTDDPGSINGGDARVSDCFCVLADDVPRVDGNAHDVVFEDIAVWAYNNNVMIFGQYCRKGNETRNITYRNIDVMVLDVPDGSAVIQCDLQNEGVVRDILIENVRVEEMRSGNLVNLAIDQNLRPFHNKWDTEGQGQLYGITIRNLTAPRATGRLMGYDPQHQVRDIRFENLVISGKPVTGIEQTDLQTNQFTADIRFDHPGK